jgi:hypothetical protein
MREDVDQQKLAFYKYRMKAHTDEIKKHLAQFGVTRARDTFDRDRRTRRCQRLDVLAVRYYRCRRSRLPRSRSATADVGPCDQPELKMTRLFAVHL